MSTETYTQEPQARRFFRHVNPNGLPVEVFPPESGEFDWTGVIEFTDPPEGFAPSSHEVETKTFAQLAQEGSI